VPDLLVADRKMLFELMAQFYQVFEVVMCKKMPGLFLCNLKQFSMPEKQHFEIFSRVGLCNPPSGSLCLTFCEMAELLHE
jgi:hypothetical protein